MEVFTPGSTLRQILANRFRQLEDLGIIPSLELEARLTGAAPEDERLVFQFVGKTERRIIEVARLLEAALESAQLCDVGLHCDFLLRYSGDLELAECRSPLVQSIIPLAGSERRQTEEIVASHDAIRCVYLSESI